MSITTTIRLYPSPEQEKLLSQTAKKYTDACNLVSAWVFDNKTTTQKKVHDNTYRDVRETTGFGSQMAASSIRTVIATYRTLHSTGRKFETRPVFKKHRYVAVYNRDYTVTKTGDISLGTAQGRTKIPFSDNKHLPISSGKMGTATIQNKRGKWIMSIPLTITVPDAVYPHNIVGIDRGIRQLAVAYDSSHNTTFYSGKGVKEKRAAFKATRSRLQAKGTRSARKRLKAIGQRENRWTRDVNHCVSKALIESYDKPTMFVLEDLTGIRSATALVRKKDRYVQVSWAYFQLEQFIRYKAKLKGHSVISVDPAYTSQTCPKCGCVSKKNRKQYKHMFQCINCGYMSNDDRVAAMNLHYKGIQYLVQSQHGTT